MSVSVQDIKALREKTGAGMMDCKEALKESGGVVEQAVVWLRQKGLADVKDRSHKAASEGLVGHYIHAGGKIGVLVEVNCETDFVARGEAFQQFARDLSMQVAAANPKWVDRDSVPAEVIAQEKEIAAASVTNKPPQVVDKIVEGRLNKFFKETCLMEQPFVKDQNLSITDLLGELISKVGERVVVKRFARFAVGE